MPSITSAVDRIVLNRVLGLPILLGIMYVMFLFTIELGKTFKLSFNLAAHTLFVDNFGILLTRLGVPERGATLLAGGLGNGIRELKNCRDQHPGSDLYSRESSPRTGERI